MFHHDNRDYRIAASAAAAEARRKFDGIIQKARGSAEDVVNLIQSRVIFDKVAPAPAVKLVVDEDSGGMNLSVAGEVHPIHRHAYSQILGDAGVPKKFADYVMEDEANDANWGAELVAHNVNTILARRERQRNLVRAEGENGPVKGFLSDKFRRLDSRPLLDAFMGACTELGLIPYEGVASDTKMRLRAVLPVVFEPLADEVMLFGAEFGNSDYGDGGVNLNLWMMRIWCTNLGVAEKCLRQIHVGARLHDDLVLSQQTYELDARTTASAIRDVTKSVVGPDRIHRVLDCISNSGEETLSESALDKILKGFDSKTEAVRIRQIYESPDVVNLPAGDTLWRLSNAVSFFAQTPELSADRKLELQHKAGVLIAGDHKPVREV